MAFFEEIGRKITNAGQGVAQQTKNMAEISRLNARISENNKKMSQLLFEMGQDYYLKHKRETDNEEQRYIDQVNALFREVMDYQDEIQRIKTAEVCKVCGARIEEGACFCVKCGARLDAGEIENDVLPPAGSTRRCSNCGSEVDADSVFCTYCGSKMPAAQTVVPRKVQPAPQYVAPTCPTCGVEVQEGDLFCQNCGTLLSE